MTKWHPLILAPFLVVYALKLRPRALREALVPAGAILLGVICVFGSFLVFGSLGNAVDRPYLSANALNFPWVMTHALRAASPESFGGLAGGAAGYIETRSWRIALLPRALFAAAYAAALAAAWRKAASFEGLIEGSLVGCWAYFIFNFGVHENHLFVVMLLAVARLGLDMRGMPLTAFLLLMGNVNLFLFYGVSGSGLGFSRVLAGVDGALALSIVNTAVFLAVWRRWMSS